MLENKEQEKIAGIISDFFDGTMSEADIDILAMKIYEKDVAKLEQDLEFTTKTANELIEIKHKLEQELAELKEKDNYHLRYGLAGADETIANLKKQLEEKDKEIERLNTIIGLSQLQVSEKDRLNTSVNINSLQYNQTQLAIRELEKVKNFVDGRTYCADYINKRIQDLKGE